MRRRRDCAAAVLAVLALGVVASGVDAPARHEDGGRRRPAGPLVVAQVPATALPSEALAGGSLRAPVGDGGRLVLVSPSGARAC